MPDENLNFPPQKGDSHGYYRVLNTTVDATSDEIYHAWETALIENHPDLNLNKSTVALEARLRRIKEAFLVLYDPVLRAWYDGPEPFVTVLDREFAECSKRFASRAAGWKAILRINKEEQSKSLDDEARERADQACREQKQLAQDAAEKQLAQDATEKKSLADKARERADQACREQKQLAQDAAERKSLAGAAIYTAWSIMFLALTPTLSNQVLRIPTTDYIVNPTLTSSVVYGLAVAQLCLGVNTKIFILDTTMKKRINYTIIGAQLFSIFILAI